MIVCVRGRCSSTIVIVIAIITATIINTTPSIPNPSNPSIPSSHYKHRLTPHTNRILLIQLILPQQILNPIYSLPWL